MESEPLPYPDGAIVYRDLSYVTDAHERQHLDLYLPQRTGDALPLIVWIHGGAFRMGSKDSGVPEEYLDDGYALASINYRLSQHALFPAQIEDCKSAVRWLRARADHFGIDPKRIAAAGPSAGGYLAAMLGTTGHVTEYDVGENLQAPSSVVAVVDFYGPTDFLQMDTHRMPEGMVHDVADSPESMLIGGPIQETPEAVARANPVTYVTSDAPPFLVVHGDRDPLVPYHQSTLLVDALQKAGVPVIFHTVEGGGHGGFTDAALPGLVRSFLAEYLQTR